DVFERLPARDEVDAVADFSVTGDRADCRVCEATRERAQGVRREDGVGVEADDDVAARVRESVVERLGLAAVLLLEESAARVHAEAFADDFARAVGRAVVNDYDLERGVVGGEQALDGFADDALLFVSGDDDGDERLEAFARARAFASARAYALRERERADEEETAYAEEDSDEERP